MAQTIQSSGRGLIRVVNDILDFSKIEAGKFSLENVPFQVHALAQEVGALLAPQAYAKGLAFACRVRKDVPSCLIGDPIRLRQVLFNLLGNAIKFTERGEAALEVKLARTVAGLAQIVFTVRDTGIGIDEKTLPRMFQPFTQADEAMSRRFGGTGLGLAISKQLVELMGGEIAIESTLGQGTTFRCRIPFKVGDVAGLHAENASSLSTRVALRDAARRLKAAPGMTPESAPIPTRVLLAEDNLINQQVAVSTLKRAGYHVQVAENGALAVQARLEHTFDVVLMDCQMPQMDGYAATAAIRAHEAQNPTQPRVPIIAVTANAMQGDRERCIAAGFDDYISKPFTRSELIAAITRWKTPAAADKVA
jgi:CheY-like chemotaxis protein